MKSLKSKKNWLLPLALILFVLEMLTLPLVIGLTYSDRSEYPEHTLTYTPGVLKWDAGTTVDANGVAQLSLFSEVWQNVQSADGEKVFAPGTEGGSIVRLNNKATAVVTYTAVLYAIKSSDSLPVYAGLFGSGFMDTDTYPLPEGVNPVNMIRAVKGSLEASAIQDFDIEWLWTFEEDQERDLLDTYLGDKAASGDADDMMVGFYLVVEDKYGATVPTTGGGSSVMKGYLVFMGLSLLLLGLVMIDRRRRSRKNEI